MEMNTVWPITGSTDVLVLMARLLYAHRSKLDLLSFSATVRFMCSMRVSRMFSQHPLSVFRFTCGCLVSLFAGEQKRRRVARPPSVLFVYVFIDNLFSTQFCLTLFHIKSLFLPLFRVLRLRQCCYCSQACERACTFIEGIYSNIDGLQ